MYKQRIQSDAHDMRLVPILCLRTFSFSPTNSMYLAFAEPSTKGDSRDRESKQVTSDMGQTVE